MNNSWWRGECLVCGECHESGNLPCTNYKWDTNGHFENVLWQFENFKERPEGLLTESESETLQKITRALWENKTSSMFEEYVGGVASNTEDKTLTLDDIEAMCLELEPYRKHREALDEKVSIFKLKYLHPLSQHYVGDEYVDMVQKALLTLDGMGKEGFTQLCLRYGHTPMVGGNKAEDLC